MPDEIKPVEPIVVNEQPIPKTKEEWTKLAQDDPLKFTKLTQERMDATFRENKELQEKLRAADEQKNNYEIDRL